MRIHPAAVLPLLLAGAACAHDAIAAPEVAGPASTEADAAVPPFPPVCSMVLTPPDEQP